MTSRPASTAGRLALILAGALAGLGSVGAGALATLEYRAAAFAALPPAQQIDRLLQGEVPRAASLRAHRGAMLACHDGLAGPQARYQPQEALDMIAATCERLAAETQDGAPGWSLASYTLALSTPEALDMARSLERSRLRAPHESWIARRRLHLATMRGALSGDGPYDVVAEVAALAGSPDGRRYLAARFRSAPDLADLVLEVAEDLAPESRLRLYRALNQGYRNRAGAGGS